MLVQLAHHDTETELQERNKDVELLKSQADISKYYFENIDSKLLEVRDEFSIIAKDFELERENGILPFFNILITYIAF
jgi:hypothetical protein